MNDSSYGEPLESRKRVLAFVEEWQRRASFPGNAHPELIYALGMEEGELQLLCSDLLELSKVIELGNEGDLMEWGKSLEDSFRDKL